MSQSLHADELSSAMNSPIISELTQDGQDAKGMAETITSFVGQSGGMLSGPGWESVNKKMAEFGEVLNERMNLATGFGDAIKSALQICLDYLAEDPATDSIDPADLDEITATRDAAQADRDYISQHMYDKKKVTTNVTNPETGEVTSQTTEEYIYDIEECKKKIAELDEAIEYANKLIKKIEKFDSVYSEAMGILEEGFAKVQEFGSKIGALVPSGRFVYDSTLPYTPSTPSSGTNPDGTQPADGTNPDGGTSPADGTIPGAGTTGGSAPDTSGTAAPPNTYEYNGFTYTDNDTVLRNEDGSIYAIVRDDGSSVCFRADGALDRTTDTNGNITLYDENGNVSYVTNSDGSQYTTYYPDGSVSSARDVSGTEYHFEQGENVRTAAPVSETPIEYNELESMPPNTTLDEDGNIVIRDNGGVILNVLHPEYYPTDSGTDITYVDPANGNQIIIHSPYGGTNS